MKILIQKEDGRQKSVTITSDMTAQKVVGGVYDGENRAVDQGLICVIPDEVKMWELKALENATFHMRSVKDIIMTFSKDEVALNEAIISQNQQLKVLVEGLTEKYSDANSEKGQLRNQIEELKKQLSDKRNNNPKSGKSGDEFLPSHSSKAVDKMVKDINQLYLCKVEGSSAESGPIDLSANFVDPALEGAVGGDVGGIAGYAGGATASKKEHGPRFMTWLPESGINIFNESFYAWIPFIHTPVWVDLGTMICTDFRYIVFAGSNSPTGCKKALLLLPANKEFRPLPDLPFGIRKGSMVFDDKGTVHASVIVAGGECKVNQMFVTNTFVFRLRILEENSEWETIIGYPYRAIKPLIVTCRDKWIIFGGINQRKMIQYLKDIKQWDPMHNIPRDIDAGTCSACIELPANYDGDQPKKNKSNQPFINNMEFFEMQLKQQDKGDQTKPRIVIFTPHHLLTYNLRQDAWDERRYKTEFISIKADLYESRAKVTAICKDGILDEYRMYQLHADTFEWRLAGKFFEDTQFFSSVRI